MEIFADPASWIALLTLTFLEIVLGVDNIIFISIVSNKLPAHQQQRARNVGLALALLLRIGMLLAITWIIRFKDPIFESNIKWKGDMNRKPVRNLPLSPT